MTFSSMENTFPFFQVFQSECEPRRHPSCMYLFACCEMGKYSYFDIVTKNYWEIEKLFNYDKWKITLTVPLYFTFCIR